MLPFISLLVIGNSVSVVSQELLSMCYNQNNPHTNVIGNQALIMGEGR